MIARSLGHLPISHDINKIILNPAEDLCYVLDQIGVVSCVDLNGFSVRQSVETNLQVSSLDLTNNGERLAVCGVLPPEAFPSDLERFDDSYALFILLFDSKLDQLQQHAFGPSYAPFSDIVFTVDLKYLLLADDKLRSVEAATLVEKDLVDEDCYVARHGIQFNDSTAEIFVVWCSQGGSWLEFYELSDSGSISKSSFRPLSFGNETVGGIARSPGRSCVAVMIRYDEAFVRAKIDQLDQDEYGRLDVVSCIDKEVVVSVPLKHERFRRILSGQGGDRKELVQFPSNPVFLREDEIVVSDPDGKLLLVRLDGSPAEEIFQCVSPVSTLAFSSKGLLCAGLRSGGVEFIEIVR
ncbi:MAG: hypothetical protein QNJ30_07715 [Kiloniellales bacterium]|nr:hypothetical protein [Kiloniellales bacterium]